MAKIRKSKKSLFTTKLDAEKFRHFMSTRAYIVKLNHDETSKLVYCHHDGYIDHCGKILHFFYSNPDLLNKLINEGNMSSLGQTIEECSFYKDEDSAATVFKTKSKLLEYINESLNDGIEYVYVFNEFDYQWHVYFKDHKTKEIVEKLVGDLV